MKSPEILNGSNLKPIAIRGEFTTWRISHNSKIWIGRIILLTAFCLIWELTARQKWLSPVFIGMPSEIIRGYLDAVIGPVLWVDGVATVTSTMTGFVLASIVGVATALILSQMRLLNDIVQPFFTALNSMPRIALAPLFVMWFGIGFASKVALSASLVFFVMLINTTAGIQSVNSDHLTLARSLGASRSSIFWKITLPSAIPSIFAGIELGIVYGFLGTVGGEMLAGSAGLGVRLQEYAGLFKTSEFFAVLLLLVTVTTVLSSAIHTVRKRLLRWQSVGQNASAT